jgi:hypothetical protein
MSFLKELLLTDNSGRSSGAVGLPSLPCFLWRGSHGAELCFLNLRVEAAPTGRAGCPGSEGNKKALRGSQK